MTRAYPVDLIAEKNVIGNCIVNPDIIDFVIDNLVVDDFYKPQHKSIFEILIDLIRVFLFNCPW